MNSITHAFITIQLEQWEAIALYKWTIPRWISQSEIIPSSVTFHVRTIPLSPCIKNWRIENQQWEATAMHLRELSWLCGNGNINWMHQVIQ